MIRFMLSMFTVYTLATISTQAANLPYNANTDTGEKHHSPSFICLGQRGAGILTQVLNTYENEGDASAYSTAQKFVREQKCGYVEDLSVNWVGRKYAKDFPEMQAYIEAPCRMLTNGHCIAIQPAHISSPHTNQEWSGYMLIEYPTDNGPAETEIARIRRGLVLRVRLPQE